MVKAFFIALLLAGLVAGAWTENVSVFVFDGKGRPLPNAFIEIRYQRDKFPIYGGAFDGYATGFTGADGGFRCTLFNQITLDQHVVGEYVIFASFQEKFASRTVKCNVLPGDICTDQQPRTEFFNLPVYQTAVKVFDSKGNPIKGATVVAGNRSVETDSEGRASFFFADSSPYNLVAIYGEMIQNATSSIRSNDSFHQFFLPVYDLTFTVMDDDALPVEARVKLGNISGYADANGVFKVFQVPFKNATAEISFGDRVKNVSAYLSKDSFQTVVIDLTPPSIGEPRFEPSGKNVIMKVEASDHGVAASGLRKKTPLVVFYSMGGRQIGLEMYAISAKEFGVTLPTSLYPNESIRYRIAAYDEEGNEAEKDGVYTPETHTPVLVAGAGGNNYLYILGAIVIIVIAVMVFKKIREES